jgi:hypothetical protein
MAQLPVKVQSRLFLIKQLKLGTLKIMCTDADPLIHLGKKSWWNLVSSIGFAGRVVI